MESDEFYDSLEEEELKYDNFKNTKCKKDILYTDSLEDELDDMIPFFDGNLSLSKINLSGQSSKCSGFSANKTKLKRQLSCTRARKSYLKLFYERTGEKCSRERNSDLQNSSNVDCFTPSPKSYTTCEDSQIIDDDVVSVYLRSNNSESEISSRYETTNSTVVPELNLDYNSESRYHSLSDLNIDSYKYNQLTVHPRNQYMYKTRNNDFGTVGPVPFNDKMESWKRRQQYGKKVSESNRIKFNERRILRNLERELQNSKICV